MHKLFPDATSYISGDIGALMREHPHLLVEAKRLDPMLEELKRGHYFCIDYRPEDDVFQTALRLYALNTRAGTQFCIKEINSLGQEGSGDYTPAAEVIAFRNKAFRRMCWFHRPAETSNDKLRALLEKATKNSKPHRWEPLFDYPETAHERHARIAAQPFDKELRHGNENS